jgi:hypothetical protein
MSDRTKNVPETSEAARAAKKVLMLWKTAAIPRCVLLMVSILFVTNSVVAQGLQPQRREIRVGSNVLPDPDRFRVTPQGAEKALELSESRPWTVSVVPAQENAERDWRADLKSLASSLDDLSASSVMPSQTLAAAALSLVFLSTLGAFSLAVRSRRLVASRRAQDSAEMPRGPRNYEAECRAKLRAVVEHWRQAEGAVMQLDRTQPLRRLLENELSSIGWRLSMYPSLEAHAPGAIAKAYSAEYWRALHREISRARRELIRVCNVATAGRENLGSKNALPEMPKTIEEAYFVLGVHAGVSDETLKRLVRVLRQCWHPDLAQSETDRTYREARIRQINVANDLIENHMAAA